MDDTVTSGGALASEIARDGDVEAGLVCGDRVRIGGIVVPGDQRFSNNRVGASLDDRNIRHTGMRGPDFDREGDNLTSRVRLHIGGVVIQLKALAKPDVAGRLNVVSLAGSNLEFSLDVA